MSLGLLLVQRSKSVKQDRRRRRRRYSQLGGGGGHWQITWTVMFGVSLSFSTAQRKYNKSR